MPPPQQFDRGDKNGIRFELKGGTNTISQSDLVPAGQYKFLANVRRFLGDRITGRAPQTDPVATMGSGPVHSLRRLNDSTPAGPVSGFTLIGGSGTSLYSNSTAVATGLSGNPISLVPFRPNTSVQPWEYVGDSSLTVNIPAPVSFNCAGMLKVRSDGLTRKDGVAEPQAAPTVTFPGGGSGPSQIFYYYVYRASETGALSNPSPVSVPGTNSQSNPSESQVAATGGVINPNITVNGTQYEGNGSQIRTTGSVAPNTTTDYIIARDFGFAIPSGVTIDGIQVDLNWLGQNSGTGALTGVALYYLGGQLGNAKSPGIQNQSFSTDTLQGGSGDIWNATLTPDIINDSTFGFGVQITTATVGGSDRSFVNSMAITVFYSTQNANITPTASTDPQVDKIDIYRQGGGLADPTYVGTNPNTATVFNDTLSDLAAATNPLLQFDNFEPFPSIDLPRSGVINVTSNVLTYVSGDHFNLRWLPGTIMLIGSPTQLAFSAVRRPTSTTSWDFTNNDPTVTPIADGTNLAWNIAEPILAAQPLPSLWGPTDNTAYMFGCFDPLRPGTLYYTKGNNPDSAPDTNQIEVTSPSEPLMNGVIVNGLGMVFSTERAWLIFPTFTTALATVTGVEGQAFNLQESITDRGLYIRSAICTEAGKRVFFRGKDGIYVSVGGSGSQSITDATIYNLFPHEGELPQPITIGGLTIYPPDDTQPEMHKLRFATGYLYYDYPAIGGGSSLEYTLFNDQGVNHSNDLHANITFPDVTSGQMLTIMVEGNVTATIPAGWNLGTTFTSPLPLPGAETLNGYLLYRVLDSVSPNSVTVPLTPFPNLAGVLTQGCLGPSGGVREIHNVSSNTNSVSVTVSADVQPGDFAMYYGTWQGVGGASADSFTSPFGAILNGSSFSSNFGMSEAWDGADPTLPTFDITGPYTVTYSATGPAITFTNLIVIIFKGITSGPSNQTIVYDVAAGGWIVDTYQHPATTHALEEGPNVNGVLVGCADGTVRNLATGGSESGTQSYVATGSNTFGDARAFQRIGDIFIKALIQAEHPVALSIYTDQYQTLQSGFSPTSLTGSGTLAPYIVDFTDGDGLDANDIATVYSWDTNSANYLDLWQPDTIDLPEITQDRPTDWDSLGGPGNKFIQGALIECDTFGQPKAIAIEDDLGNLHVPIESPITADGQTVKVLTFAQPFTAHLVRILSTDGIPWRVWPNGDGTSAFDFKPYPEASTHWETEASTNAQIGYMHVYALNLAYIATATVTFQIVSDQGTFTRVYPATSTGALQPAKIFQLIARNKWKVASYKLTSSEPFYIWKDLCELWIKPWGSQDAYLKLQPFGDSTGQGAEV